VLVNRAYCALLGYSREELLGERYSIIIPPEQQALAQRAYDGSFEGISSDGEWPLMRRGGQVFAASIESTAFVTAEGRNLLVSSVQDLTERKRHELMWAKLDARISQSQKLESLGLLAGGIAHDFSNVLAGIVTNLDQLCEGGLGEERGEILRDLREAAQGASSLIQTLTAYAGQRPAARRTADLGALVEETVRLLRTSLKREQRCMVALDDGPLLAQVDASQLQQVLINLIINAQEATAEGGRPVEVRLTRRILGATEQVDLVTASLIRPGLYAIISVQDWGVGIDMASQQRIFDPFFTTKTTGRGLGLSSAAGIVRAHGGSIQLTSAPGEGSTFDVLLPLELEPAASE
jgi:PAS domain S-box-containing protein